MLRVIRKFSEILDKEQKHKIVIIVFLMLIGAVLETMSVSLVVPLVTALMQDDFMETNQIVVAVCETFHIESSKTFIMLCIAALIFLFIAKDIFLYFEYYVQTRFISNNRMATQRRLMDVYLHRPYEFFLNAL